jgi:hypothetical protein
MHAVLSVFDSEGTGGSGCVISHAMVGISHGDKFGFIVQPARQSLPECLAQGQEFDEALLFSRSP